MNNGTAGLCLLALVVFASTGCVYVETTEGSGAPGTQRSELSDFSKIEINGAFDLVTVEICDCDTAAIVRGDDNLIGGVELEVDDGELEINGGDGFAPVLPLEVRVQTRHLERIEFNGVGRASVNGVFNDAFEVEHNGVGAVKLRGEVRELDVENAGTGHVDASRLVARIAEVNSAGTGDVEVCATHQLAANLSGLGSIFYSCEPATIDSSVSGTGSVRAR